MHFIARGAHLRALREHGLTVRSVRGDFQVQAPATDDPGDVGPCDFVLFCVKTFDTDAAAARLGPLVGDGTAVVSLQNGVENHLRPLGQAPRKRRQKRPTSPTPSRTGSWWDVLAPEVPAARWSARMMPAGREICSAAAGAQAPDERRA